MLLTRVANVDVGCNLENITQCAFDVKDSERSRMDAWCQSPISYCSSTVARYCAVLQGENTAVFPPFPPIPEFSSLLTSINDCSIISSCHNDHFSINEKTGDSFDCSIECSIHNPRLCAFEDVFVIQTYRGRKITCTTRTALLPNSTVKRKWQMLGKEEPTAI